MCKDNLAKVAIGAKSIATALNNITALNLAGNVDKDQWKNESDNEEITDLCKNILIERYIVESSDDSDGEETAINSVVVIDKVDRVLKSVECPVEAEYEKEMKNSGV